MITLFLSAAFASAPCLTPALLADMPPVNPGPMPPPSPDKGTRDAYGLPNSAESENFIMRWGDTGGVREADVQDMLDAFELAWSIEVVEMDHPAPETTDVYKFNVYVGDTGGDAPSAMGAAGYYYTDAQGYPMIVLARDTVAYPDYGAPVAPHEFYHAVQDATHSYSYTGASAWFWEATAMWVEGEVYPDNPDYATFLFGYAFLPHYPISYFDYPDSGALGEYHQYGAFIFPRYLTEVQADWQVIRDVWVDPATNTNDPLEDIRAELAGMDIDMDEVFGDFAARNATWDYTDGDTYQANCDAYSGYYPGQDHRITDDVGAGGTGGWAQVDADLLPQRYGYNVIELDAPADGKLEVGFQGDAEGDEGSEAGWAVSLVTDDGAQLSRVPLTLEAGAGSVTVEGITGQSLLVVAAWSEDTVDGETFGYRYRVGPADDEAEDTAAPVSDPPSAGDAPVACGCATARRGSLAWWLAPLLLGWRRRRDAGAGV